MKNFLCAFLFLLPLAPIQNAKAQDLRFVAPKNLGEVKAARLSPDGKWTLISGSGGLSLWETATARRVIQFEDAKSNLAARCAIAWSPDGRFFAVALPNKVQLWSMDTLTPLRSLAPSDPAAHEKWPDRVQAMAFDASGKTLATGSYDRSARLWDVATGKLLRVFRGDSFAKKGHSDHINDLTFAKNGKWLITVAADGDARVWEVATGSCLRDWDSEVNTTHKGISRMDLRAVACARDGETIAVGGGGFNRSKGSDIFLWNATTGRKLRELHVNNYDASVNSLAFSPDGKTLLAGISTYSDYDDPLILWDVASGKRLKTFVGHRKMLGAATSVQFARDGKSFLSGSEDQTVRLWNVSGGDAMRVFLGSSLENYHADLSFDGNLALAGLANGDVRVVDAASGHLIKNLDEMNDVDAVKFSPDARLVAASANLKVMVWDARSGKKIGEGKSSFNHRLVWSADSSRLLAVYQDGYDLFSVSEAGLKKIGEHYVQRLHDATLSADGRHVYTAHLYTKMMVLDTQSDKPVLTWTIPSEPQKIALAPDESLVATLSNGKIAAWDAKSGALVSTMTAKNAADIAFDQNNAKTLVTRGENGEIGFFEARSGKPAPNAFKTASTPFLAGGRLLLDANYSQSLALKNTQTGAKSIHYLSLQEGDWLAYTDDGHFDGSPGGIAKVSFARGKQTYLLEQFAEQFYQPGLMSRILGATSSPPVASAQTVLAQGAPPLVRIVSPTPGASSKDQIEVTVQAQEQNNGGIKAIRLYQNGRLVGGPSALRGIVVEAAPQSANAKNQKFNVTLAPGDNVFRAVAYSQTDLESLPAEIKLTFAGSTQKPALYVLVVGINEYKDATMNLTYARPDAEAMANFFDTTARNCGLFSGVQVTQLIDEAASGAAIKGALAKISVAAKPEDMVFLYLAGHGDTATSSEDAKDGAPETFYFLPYEMRQMAMKERVRQYGISRDQINEAVTKIPARKIVLVYDACKSGAAVEGASRGAGDEQQALAQMARAQGIYVLAASTGQQYAGEVKALGHGILTYALLEGLGGKAAGADSIVKVSQLFAYTDERVPALAKEYRGREQWPVSFGKGQNFPLVVNR